MKRVMLVGGTWGLGSALKQELENRGFFVFVISKSMGLDIRSEKSVEKLKIGNIDILINCAGVVLEKPLKETSIEEWNNIFNTNTRGVFLILKKVLPKLKENGIIINVSSIMGEYGFKNFSVYGASKAALISLSKALAKEIPQKVYTVCPSAIKTSMSGFKGMEPKEVAKEIVKLCDGKRKSGSVMEIFGRNELYGLAKIWW